MKKKNLKIKISKYDSKRQETVSYSKDFKLIPIDLKRSNKTLLPNDTNKTVRVSRLEEASPIKKVPKSKTTVKYVHQLLEKSEDVGISDDDDDTIDLAFDFAGIHFFNTNRSLFCSEHRLLRRI